MSNSMLQLFSHQMLEVLGGLPEKIGIKHLLSNVQGQIALKRALDPQEIIARFHQTL